MDNIDINQMADIIGQDGVGSIVVAEHVDHSFFLVTYKEGGRYHDLYFESGVTKGQVIDFLRSREIDFYESYTID